MNKNSKIIIGILLLLLAGTIGYHEFAINKYKGIVYAKAFVVKENISIMVGSDITETNIDIVYRDMKTLPEGTITSSEQLKDQVAIQNIYGKEVITNKKVISKKDYYKDNERIVCMYVNKEDEIEYNDLRPGDKVDLFLYDSITETYNLEKEDIEILNLRNKDNIDYQDNKNDTVFSVQAIYFKSTNEEYKSLMDKLSKKGNKFTLTLHGNRPKNKKIIEKSSDGIISNITK